ncbi:MAG: efflux RND transporter permease subunit, partial [Nannocystaceae bacterium]|nr:efflux RND transporter permease subunit [Nannocystaceae bacterium]
MKPQLANNAIVRLSLRRPITMMMILLSAVVLGFVALSRIPLELIPAGFSAPFLSVSVSYPDATARDVEEKITLPLEQAIATTPGLDRISSTSSAGGARVSMVFKSDTSMDIAYREVRDRIARIRDDLPDDVKDVEIHKQSADSLPVAIYAVVWEPDVVDPYGIIDRKIKRPLARIDGVGLVNLWGETKEQVYIEIDRARADAHGIDIFNLVQKLRRDNFAVGQGSVREGGTRYLLRTVMLWESPEDIGNTVIGQRAAAGGDLRLRDIATVELRRPDVTRYDRYKGRPSLMFGVLKESQANTVDVSDRIKAAVQAARASPELSQFKIERVFVQGDTIRYSLGQVFDAGRQGGILALLILLFFLRRLRLTLLISLAIPLSLFLSLPVMYFSGQSINLVSLIGLMICIGLVVDNSVVVAENISRFRKRGLGAYAAALQGTGEVALAITLATMTTVVVFLPAALLSKGTTQFFMVRMVTPVCVSLIMSLFVAVVLVPLASVTVLREDSLDLTRLGGFGALLNRADVLWKAILERAYESTMGRLNRAYTRLLRLSLRRRMDVVMVALLALASAVFPMTQVRCASGENFGSRNVTVSYSMPSNTTLDEANAFFLEVEGMLEARAEALHIEGAYSGFDDSSGRIQVFFKKPQPGQPSFKSMAQAVIEIMPERPGWDMRSRFGQSDGAKDDAVRFPIYGKDHDAVTRAREALEARLVEIPGVLGIHQEGGDTRRRDELSLRIERDMSQRFGVPAAVVANTVAWAIRGAPLPRFHTDEREVDVIVRYAAEDRENVDQLLGYTVPSERGGKVPIEIVARKSVTEGETTLSRFNKRVSAVVALDLSSGERAETLDRLRKFLNNYKLPEGLSFDADDSVRAVEEMQRDLMGALGLGTIFILLIMGFLFESFVLPLPVLPSIPLSFVGVYWFLYATGENIDGLAGIGMVLLLGVVVNNAIVLVDFINGARAMGLSRVEAVVQAGNLRFRP